eukprot:764241-Hanusia_phi.AAC.3
MSRRSIRPHTFTLRKGGDQLLEDEIISNLPSTACRSTRSSLTGVQVPCIVHRHHSLVHAISLIPVVVLHRSAMPRVVHEETVAALGVLDQPPTSRQDELAYSPELFHLMLSRMFARLGTMFDPSSIRTRIEACGRAGGSDWVKGGRTATGSYPFLAM